MKSSKVFLLFAVLLIAGSFSAYGQSWLDRLKNTADKVNEAVHGVNEVRETAESIGNVNASATGGRITITGLGAYNGKYVTASGGNSDSSVVLTAADDFAGTASSPIVVGGQVSGGRVTLKVWKVQGNSAVNYTGNDSGIMLAVGIYSKQQLSGSERPDAAGLMTVNFSSGTASGVVIIP